MKQWRLEITANSKLRFPVSLFYFVISALSLFIYIIIVYVWLFVPLVSETTGSIRLIF